MQATTTIKLENVLKDTWNPSILESLGYDIEKFQEEVRRNMNRQLYQNPRYGGYTEVDTTGNVVHVPVIWSSNPAEHKARVEEMSQRYAALKRGNKPSYRQRQKNAKAARNGSKWPRGRTGVN